MLIALVQWIIDAAAAICAGLEYPLPSSPFKALNGLTVSNDILGAIAWLVPFPQIIVLLEAWGAAIFMFYAWMMLLRWIKAI